MNSVIEFIKKYRGAIIGIIIAIILLCTKLYELIISDDDKEKLKTFIDKI